MYDFKCIVGVLSRRELRGQSIPEHLSYAFSTLKEGQQCDGLTNQN